MVLLPPLQKKGAAAAAAGLLLLLLLLGEAAAAAESSTLSSYPSGVSLEMGLEKSAQGARPGGKSAGLAAVGDYVYTGSSEAACGGDAGLIVWDVSDRREADMVARVPPPTDGTYLNGITVATLSNGDVILAATADLCPSYECEVSGNGVEVCPGRGIELFDLSDPTDAKALGHVSLDAVNQEQREVWGAQHLPVSSVKIFSRDGADYLAAAAGWHPNLGPMFGGLQFMDLSDPSNVTPLGSWGPEEVLYVLTDFATLPIGDLFYNAYVRLAGEMGVSSDETVTDVEVASDGSQAFVACGDSGIFTLDLTDLSSPSASTQAKVPDGSDETVNAWRLAQHKSLVLEVESRTEVRSDKLRIVGGKKTFEMTQGALALPPLVSFGPEGITGTTYFVGLACSDGGELPAADAEGTDIALIMRGGGCDFSEKIANAKAAGYKAAVVFNNDGDESLVTMVAAMDVAEDIPSTFVAHSTALEIAGVDSIDALTVDADGDGVIDNDRKRTQSIQIFVETTSWEWGSLNIWDWQDPEKPVLASHFMTQCGAFGCAETYGSRSFDYGPQNAVIREEEGGAPVAYIAYGTEGVIRLDLSNPYSPRELGRFVLQGDDFVEGNGGDMLVTGVALSGDGLYVHALDESGGLFVLKPNSDTTLDYSLAQQGAVGSIDATPSGSGDSSSGSDGVSSGILALACVFTALGTLILTVSGMTLYNRRKRGLALTQGEDTGLGSFSARRHKSLNSPKGDGEAPSATILQSFRSEHEAIDLSAHVSATQV